MHDLLCPRCKKWAAMRLPRETRGLRAHVRGLIRDRRYLLRNDGHMPLIEIAGRLRPPVATLMIRELSTLYPGCVVLWPFECHGCRRRIRTWHPRVCRLRYDRLGVPFMLRSDDAC